MFSKFVLVSGLVTNEDEKEKPRSSELQQT